jgi:beta-glucosidase
MENPQLRRFWFLAGFGLACVLALAGCGTTPKTAAASTTGAPGVITPVVAPVPVAAAGSAVLPAGNGTAAAARPNTAVIPVPQRVEDRLPQSAVNNFLARHERYTARAQQGGIDVLFLGDSITQGWEGPGRAVWNQYYGGMKAVSFGVGYDRTQQVLWRLQNGEGEGFSPKVVVLMIGTNNIGLNTSGEIAAGVGAIVRELRGRFPAAKILLLGIFPRDYPGSRNRRLVAEANALIAGLNDGERVFYLDLADKFIGADGTIAPELMANNPPLHPTAQGYAVWAEAIREPLGKLMQ